MKKAQAVQSMFAAAGAGAGAAWNGSEWRHIPSGGDLCFDMAPSKVDVELIKWKVLCDARRQCQTGGKETPKIVCSPLPEVTQGPIGPPRRPNFTLLFSFFNTLDRLSRRTSVFFPARSSLRRLDRHIRFAFNFAPDVGTSPASLGTRKRQLGLDLGSCSHVYFDRYVLMGLELGLSRYHLRLLCCQLSVRRRLCVQGLGQGGLQG